MATWSAHISSLLPSWMSCHMPLHGIGPYRLVPVGHTGCLEQFTSTKPACHPISWSLSIHFLAFYPFFSERDALSPHDSQFPRFHMSGQTTWQITYESLLGKMLRLRNSCLWICSVTNKQTWGTPDSDYISNSQERKSHTENKRKTKKK